MVHASFRGIAVHPIFERCRVFDDAGREVWHRVKALVAQTGSGRHHVFDRGAIDVRDVNAGASGQQVAEVLNLFCGARHHFDRVTLEECFQISIGRGHIFFFTHKRKQCHHGLLKRAVGHA